MTEPFEPPVERATRPALAGTVVLAWMMAGAAVGMAGGLTAQMVGMPPSVASGLGIGLTALTTLAGVIAFWVERGLSKSRPALLDGHGRMSRPLHGALFALPILIAGPALLTLIIVGSVATQSLVPALIFGVGGFGLGWAARRVASAHTLTAALEALEAGDILDAKARLHRLDAGWGATRSGRTMARLNLGMLALGEGDLDRAASFYGQVETGAGSAFARAGLALVRVLQDRLDEAEIVLLEAMNGPGSTVIQGQVDAVRLLLLMRRNDPAAKPMAEQLLTEESGELFRGLLALLRVQNGDSAGAQSLMDRNTSQALEESGWREVIPEIAELFAEPALVH